MYKTAEELTQAIESYFEFVKGERFIPTRKAKKGEIFPEWSREPEPITITGLCIYIGFESKQSFYDLEEKEEFSYPIKHARLKVENGYEKKLSGAAVAGPIFALKNMGWTDRTEISGPQGGPIQTQIITGMEVK